MSPCRSRHLAKRLVSAVSADTFNLAMRRQGWASDTMGITCLLVSRIPVALFYLRVEPPFALPSLVNVGFCSHRLHAHRDVRQRNLDSALGRRRSWLRLRLVTVNQRPTKDSLVSASGPPDEHQTSAEVPTVLGIGFALARTGGWMPQRPGLPGLHPPPVRCRRHASHG